MPSRVNQLILRELEKEFGPLDTCVFLDFTGLTGRKAADLRHQLKVHCGPNARFAVVKNTLARRIFAAIQGSDRSNADPYLSGPTAIVFGADDPVVLVRVLADWSRKQEVLRFKGGLLAGRPLAPDAVARLARIPTRPVLLAQAVGSVAAPLTNLLALSCGVIRKLMRLVDALATKRTESGTI